MGRIAFSTTILTAALAISFALATFLSRIMLEDARAVGIDFRHHEAEAKAVVAELRGSDALQAQKTAALEKKIDEANQKLDLILQQLIK